MKVSYENLAPGHPIRTYCEKHGITNAEARHDLCILIMNAVKTAAVSLIGEMAEGD